jgi:surface antigen
VDEIRRLLASKQGRSVRMLFALVSIGSAWLYIASGASAALPLRHVRLSVHERKHVLSVNLSSAAGAKCSLRITAGHQKAAFTVWKVASNGKTLFKWDVPADAPSGKWKFSAFCEKRRVKHSAERTVRLRHKGADNGSLVDAYNGDSGKGGGNQSCQKIESGGSGQVCFINDPVASYIDPYAGADIGQCTWYAMGMRPDLDNITRGNAAQWLSEAQAAHVPTGSVPVVGAIAVNTTADVVNGKPVGHVAYVAGVTNGGATLILDEANLHYAGGVFLNVATPAADFQGYIYGGPAGSGPGTTPPTPTPNPTPPAGTYAETSGGSAHTWADYATAGGAGGPTLAAGQTVDVTCRVQGYTVSDGNNWWYQLASSPWNNTYYVTADTFYNNRATSGSLSNTPFVDDKVALCSTTPTPTPTTTTPSSPPPPPAPQTWGETAGSVAHTWTNYENAGGTEGPSVGDGQTVQIACRLTGFTVSDGNTWWYRIAQAPWSDSYYVSADAFYNNGATSGSLVGTPFVDTAVAVC